MLVQELKAGTLKVRKNAEGSVMSGAALCCPTKADGTLLFPTLCPVTSHRSLEIGYGWQIYNVEIGTF